MTRPEWVTKLQGSTVLAWVWPWLLLVATALIMVGGWHWDRLGAGLVIAAAAMLSGGVIGFVFGVPRTRANDDAGPAGEGARVFANTNLEQISDWLTKILVGVGLTQFATIGRATEDLFVQLAPAFGGQPKGKAFAGGLVLFSVIFGFIAGWLNARLKLGTAMAVADHDTDAALRQAASLLVKADRAAKRGDQQTASQLQTEATFVMARAAEIAASYESTRATMPSSMERTAEFDRLADDARKLAHATRFDRVKVRELLASGTVGGRIVALAIMGARAEAFDLDGVINAILVPRSANEQYQALIAAQSAMQSLDPAAKRELRSAVEQVLTVVGSDTARAGVAAVILASLGDQQ